MRKISMHAVTAAVLIGLYSLSSAAPPRGRTETRSFTVIKGGELIVAVENIGADIRVAAWDKNEVIVKVEGISEDDMKDLSMSQEGNTVRVAFSGSRSWRRSSSARFTVNVPSEFSLNLGTSGGDIEVDGSIKGRVEASTAGGDIEIDDVEGQLTLRTSGGDITGGEVKGDAKISTAGGDIVIRRVTGRLEVATAGGDIKADEVGKDLDAKTAGGDIVAGNVGGNATASTAGGDIEMGRVGGTVALKTAGGDIEIRGAKGEASAKTAGGDIELGSLTGYVQASTAGGDIRVELMPSDAANSRLETEGGDIELYLPANAKATIEARIRLRERWGRDGDKYDVYSDFKAETHEKTNNDIRARYILNGGGKTIFLETRNGNIEIRKLDR